MDLNRETYNLLNRQRDILFESIKETDRIYDYALQEPFHRLRDRICIQANYNIHMETANSAK